MSCPKTAHLMQEYFADHLTPLASEELDRHLAQCADCQTELDQLLATRSSLQAWREESVPHWDRGMELYRREHRVAAQPPRAWSIWQWLPTAASFAMLGVLLLNTTLVSSEQGFSISFGTDSESQRIEQLLTDFARRQQDQLQAVEARLAARQDSNNIQVLEAVLEQTQQATANNMDRLYAYFEQQRLQDLQAMRAGYEELVDSDYQTISSLRQLAQYVSFDADLP
ncbi:MAG: hypothetical protein PsegKO_20430 [Pseudohongiellaceae bacterium]